MGVRVKFFADFKEILGQKEVEVPAEDVSNLLEKVTGENEELKEELFENGDELRLDESVSIMVNGRKTELLDGINTELEDGDTVAIFPPVAGG